MKAIKKGTAETNGLLKYVVKTAAETPCKYNYNTTSATALDKVNHRPQSKQSKVE